MEKRNIAKLVGGMLNMIATATGYALDISEVTNISANWWPLITLVIGIILVTWVILDLNGQINRLLDTRPTITIQPISENNIYYLKVHNNGAEGILKAQIDLFAEDPSVGGLKGYDGYWQKANCNESKILPNQYDSVKIAERISSPPDYNSVHLRIYYYNPKLMESLSSTGGEAQCDTASHWIGSTITSPDGSTRPLTKHEYKLCITISASPRLREGVYQGHYILDIDGLRLDPSPQLGSHKEGSQS